MAAQRRVNVAAPSRGDLALARFVCGTLICLAAASCTSMLGPSQPAPGRPAPPSSERSERGDQAGARRAPEAAPSTVPDEPRARSNTAGASQTLLAQSRAERAAGSYTQAASSIERALRIDPNNPALWIELAEIQLDLGNTGQAQTMARKALTLADGNRALESRAERLLRSAAAR